MCVAMRSGLDCVVLVAGHAMVAAACHFVMCGLLGVPRLRHEEEWSYLLEPPEEPIHDLGVVLAVQPFVIKHGHTAQHSKLPSSLTLQQCTCNYIYRAISSA